MIVIAGLVHELNWSVLDGGRRAGLELHVSQHSVDQLDVVALAGHEVAALGVGVGDHVLVSQQGVHVTASGPGGGHLNILQWRTVRLKYQLLYNINSGNIMLPSSFSGSNVAVIQLMLYKLEEQYSNMI